jgi:hypothetical protein
MKRDVRPPGIICRFCRYLSIICRCRLPRHDRQNGYLSTNRGLICWWKNGLAGGGNLRKSRQLSDSRYNNNPSTDNRQIGLSVDRYRLFATDTSCTTFICRLSVDSVNRSLTRQTAYLSTHGDRSISR